MAFLRRKPKEVETENANLETISSSQDLINFAQENGIETNPLDISRLTKQLGIIMRLEPMEGEDSGSLTKNKNGEWIMKVNSLHHPHRQRFTIAHELGHFIKHGMLTTEFLDTVFFRNGETNTIETEANKFAAELLMPEIHFRKFIDTSSKKVSDIAEFFQVSSMAVRVRAKQLGYGGHNL